MESMRAENHSLASCSESSATCCVHVAHSEGNSWNIPLCRACTMKRIVLSSVCPVIGLPSKVRAVSLWRMCLRRTPSSSRNSGVSCSHFSVERSCSPSREVAGRNSVCTLSSLYSLVRKRSSSSPVVFILDKYDLSHAVAPSTCWYLSGSSWMKSSTTHVSGGKFRTLRNSGVCTPTLLCSAELLVRKSCARLASISSRLTACWSMIFTVLYTRWAPISEAMVKTLAS
mmetsp:Transcript_100418/g.273056  ORF Transcript_100418/g.273056 Transcript_100418/m.273056 type:complete len:228 (+) Transcript_100418:1591-2274(+)